MKPDAITDPERVPYRSTFDRPRRDPGGIYPESYAARCARIEEEARQLASMHAEIEARLRDAHAALQSAADLLTNGDAEAEDADRVLAIVARALMNTERRGRR